MPDPKNRLSWVATVKPYPAIGDMQAIKDSILRELVTPVGVAGPIYQDLYTVPIDTIGITTVFSLVCTTANPTTALPYIKRGANYYYLGTATIAVAWEIYCIAINAAAITNDIIGVLWNNCQVGDNVWSTYVGYNIPLY